MLPIVLFHHQIHALGKIPELLIESLIGLLGIALMVKMVAAFARFVPQPQDVTNSDE
jgi:hypothetical protein